mmetsp:Transcript_39474/g.103335  ORF Transcript_39474/g.103335 Transcript_39474/m.103335 type:complete len:385 (+) Transcript_39474:240-1394(+)
MVQPLQQVQLTLEQLLVTVGHSAHFLDCYPAPTVLPTVHRRVGSRPQPVVDVQLQGVDVRGPVQLRRPRAVVGVAGDELGGVRNVNHLQTLHHLILHGGASNIRRATILVIRSQHIRLRIDQLLQRPHAPVPRGMMQWGPPARVPHVHIRAMLHERLQHLRQVRLGGEVNRGQPGDGLDGRVGLGPEQGDGDVLEGAAGGDEEGGGTDVGHIGVRPHVEQIHDLVLVSALHCVLEALVQGFLVLWGILHQESQHIIPLPLPRQLHSIFPIPRLVRGVSVCIHQRLGNIRVAMIHRKVKRRPEMGRLGSWVALGLQAALDQVQAPGGRGLVQDRRLLLPHGQRGVGSGIEEDIADLEIQPPGGVIEGCVPPRIQPIHSSLGRQQR